MITKRSQNAGLALEETMTDTLKVKPRNHYQLDLIAHDKSALLYDFLDKLISAMDADGLVFSKFTCNLYKTWSLKDREVIVKDRLFADFWGEPFDPSRHESRTAIKAPTFHGMKIDSLSERPISPSSLAKGTIIHFLLDL